MATGGATVGGPTLTIFYALHTTLVPVLIIALAALHFWRVRKAGDVVIPRADGEELPQHPKKVLSLPNLFLKELAVGLILTALVVALATAFPPPLGAPANPGMSPNPAKAPWYFVGFQELLLHFHPVLATTFIRLLAFLALVLLPYLPYEGDPQGIWGASPAGRRMAVTAALTATVLTAAWILVDDLVLRHGSWLPGLPPLIGQGVLPAVVLFGIATGFLLVLKRRFSGTLADTVQAAFLRLVSGELYGIPPEHVQGTSVHNDFITTKDGTIMLLRSYRMDYLDNWDGKPRLIESDGLEYISTRHGSSHPVSWNNPRPRCLGKRAVDGP